MSNRPKSLRVVVLSANPVLATQVEQNHDRESITLVQDFSSLEKAVSSRTFDGIVLDGEGYSLEEFATLNGRVDLSNTFFLAGPLPTLDSVSDLLRLVADSPKKSPAHPGNEVNLADYVESKFGDFVRAMKLGSARNLYPTLMRAVELPLIKLALRETNGNQMQAAQLLGMNRNTLRKKIGEFKISVKRQTKQSDRQRKPE